jgi:hypothetical protein
MLTMPAAGRLRGRNVLTMADLSPVACRSKSA